MPPWPWPDVALFDLGVELGPAATVFDARVPTRNEELEAFGFPNNADDGGEISAVVYQSSSYLRRFSSEFRLVFRGGQIAHGMSGGPLYSPGDPPKIVGMVTSSNDPTRLEGGVALPSVHLRAALSEFVALDLHYQPTVLPDERLTTQVIESTASSAALELAKPPASELPFATAAEAAAVLSLVASADAARRMLHFDEALSFAELAIKDAAYARLPASIRAKALRALAHVQVRLDPNPERARGLEHEASALDADPVAEALLAGAIALAEGGYEAAIDAIPAGLSAETNVARAGYLLQGGRVMESDALLRSLPISELEKPRVRLVRLSVAVALKRRIEALQLAEGLVAAASEDVVIALAVMQTFVLGCAPTEFWPDALNLLGAPQPVPRSDIVEDEQQRGRLRSAASMAETLIGDGHLIELRDLLRTLRLAALGYDPSRAELATTAAEELLKRESPVFYAVPWVWALDLPIDLEPALAFLSSRAEAGLAAAEEILLLASAKLRDRRADSAEAILRRHHTAFKTTEERSKCALFMLQCMIGQNRSADAAAMVDDVTEPGDRQMAERLLLESGEDRKAVLAQLRDRWTESGDAIALLIACEIANRLGDWTFLADHGKALLARFGNASSARFAMYGAYNSQRYSDALERYAEFASTGVIVPNDLRRLRAFALDRVGDPATLAAFEALIATDPSDDNYFAAGLTFLRRGDYAVVVSLGQRLLGNSDVSTRTALAFAAWVRTANADLARSLWRRAIGLGIPHDDLVTMAFNLAHQLGISDETGPLQEPLSRLAAAGEGGIRAVTQEQLVEVVRAATERSADLFEKYRGAQIPVHFICAATNITLMQTHVAQVRENAKAGSAWWTPIFVRHGGRAVDEALLVGRGSPLLDATSFLLAMDLDVFEDIINAFGVVRVSRQLGPLLAVALDDNDDGQPRLPFISALLEAVRANKLSMVTVTDRTVDEAAADIGAALCDWWSPNNAALHGQNGTRWFSPRRLVESLMQRGLIDQQAFDVAVRVLGNIQESEGNEPPRSGPLLLRDNVAEMLVECGLLDVLTRVYDVSVEAEYVKRVERQISEARDKLALSEWIASATERLRRGINDRTIILVNDRVESEQEDRNSLDIRILMSIFAALPEDGFVVVDDRYTNVLPRRDDEKPIASLWDVLRHLHVTGRIESDRFYAAVLRMRKRGLMYIPIEGEEIAYHVSRARIDGNVMTTSDEMKTLERYIARALLDKEALYAATPIPNGVSVVQASFLIGLAAGIRHAVRLLLFDASAEAEARATWVHDHLASDGLPGFGISHFGGPGVPPQNVVDFEAANLLGDYLSS